MEMVPELPHELVSELVMEMVPKMDRIPDLKVMLELESTSESKTSGGQTDHQDVGKQFECAV